MNITLLKSNKKFKKRVGRGNSSGKGMTAGRGTKGQKSRSGHNIPKRHEGGQTPLSMRLPKIRGKRRITKKVSLISLDDISKNYKNGDEVCIKSLTEKGLIKKNQQVKILNNGNLSVKVTIGDVKVSKSAQKKFVSTPKTKSESKLDKKNNSK